MPFPATAVANEFLTIAKAQGKDLTPMKLQKLVYFAHGWFLALTGAPLISERIEAWQYGPVIPSLYRQFREYGDSSIGFPAIDSHWDGGRPTFAVSRLDTSGLPSDDVERARKLIQKVWDTYGGFTAARLSNATHAQGSPWSQVYAEGARNVVIPDDKIKEYFQRLGNADGQ